MRISRPAVLLALLFLSLSASAQQVQQGAASTQSAPKDPVGVSVLTQALNVAGGMSAVMAIQDYTATGNVTHPLSATKNLQGTVTIKGTSKGQVRVDASLPQGVRSMSVSNGLTTIKAENGRITQLPPKHPIPASDVFPYKAPLFPNGLIFPHLELAAVVNNPIFSISDKGIVTLDGQSARHIQAQLILPWNEAPQPAHSISAIAGNQGSSNDSNTLDFFLDASTLQVLMIQDVGSFHTVHQVRYSDYKLVNGVLMPFSITEKVGNTTTREIQVNQVGVNTGLIDSDFAF